MIQLFNEDNLNVMKKLVDESIDIICIDPPYLYLKNQKLERAFDELKFFSECKRLLTKNGFIIMFGRGESFYRWNTILADLGFVFKEEIIWDKRRASSPLLNLNRVHELISVFTKKNGIINKIRVPYLNTVTDNNQIEKDIKRVLPILKNPKELQDVIEYLKSGNLNNRYNRVELSATVSSQISTPSPCVNTVKTFIEGKIEKSIISEVSSRNSNIHPTQKPTPLIERLLNLTLPKKDEITVADFFAGSMSTMEAVLNLQKENPDKEFKGIAVEIDQEYFEAGKERIENYLNFERLKF